MKLIKVGSDYSGVGAFKQAMKRVADVKKFTFEQVFACDMDKYARLSYIMNYGNDQDRVLIMEEFKKNTFVDPNAYSFYFPPNVYGRRIPLDSLDVYMTSPPCQGFSMAGLRKGSILFYNSHEFIRINKPRFFIFENVKGLLSHDKSDEKDEFGKTFREWMNLLGGKSVNGVPVLFPHEESVPYHVYFAVMNAKEHGVPQNRERVFIVGIRDDVDNNFSFPKEEFLERKLVDCLEDNVDDKYFLSEEMLKGMKHFGIHKYVNQKSQASRVYKDTEDVFGTLCDGSHGYANGYVQLSRRRSEEGRRKRRESMSKGKDYTSFKDREFFVQGDGSIANTIVTSPTVDNYITDYQNVRRLTPRECFRLQDFTDEFKFVCSDTQLYKQAGNSIPIKPLEKIISKLNL